MILCNTEIMKMIKALETEKEDLIAFERRNSSISYTATEKPDSIVDIGAAYDILEINASIDEKDAEIRRLKHILNKTNSEKILDGFDMTVGQGIVYMAQLSSKVKRLEALANTDGLVRKSGGWRGGEAEYTQVKYDVEEARQLLKKAKAELTKLQVSIDRTNLLNEIEV
jgi:hypothetical protein